MLEVLKLWPKVAELQYGKFNSGCAPGVDSDQPGHPPSLISVFAVRMKKPWVLSYPLSAQKSHWSNWADAQADLSLRRAHSHYCWFRHVAGQLVFIQKTWHFRYFRFVCVCVCVCVRARVRSFIVFNGKIHFRIYYSYLGQVWWENKVFKYFW